MTVKKIGEITLTYPLWWLEYNNTPAIKAESQSTINGGVIVWEQAVDITAKNITLASKDRSGWQTTAIKDLIKALVAGSLGTTTTITTTADEVINVRFRHENSAGAATFERVVDNKLFDYYTANIYLARV